MSRKSNRRKIKATVASQTLWHLNRFSIMDGHPGDIGRTIDKLTREKVLSLKGGDRP